MKRALLVVRGGRPGRKFREWLSLAPPDNTYAQP